MFLEAKNISFAYKGRKPVLQGVLFEVEKGNTLAIVGASGCGKSTLLKIIANILPQKGDAVGGEITVDGQSAFHYRTGGKLAYMFQEPTLLPHLNVAKNVGVPLDIAGKPNAAKVIELLHTVGLTEFADYLPKDLSGGMKTRVSLARSFITAPELLLLDEPFSALDIAWKANLYERLKELQNLFGTTVVLVTHDIEEAIRLADTNIIVLGKSGVAIPYESHYDPIRRKEQIEHLIVADHALTHKSNTQQWARAEA